MTTGPSLQFAKMEFAKTEFAKTECSMRSSSFHQMLLLLLGILLTAQLADAATPDEAHFVTRVLPVLKNKCFACHGAKPDDLKGEFDLTNRAAMLKGGESEEAAVTPGKPDDSPLFEAIQWAGLEMPPKENDRLNDAQIADFEKWIADGASWPNEETIAAVQAAELSNATTDQGILVSTSGGLSDEWTNRRYKPEDIWAFRPLANPAVPDPASNNGNNGNEIDRFINAKLRAAGLKPTATAPPETLVRRAYYDLLGLPPNPKQVEKFLADWKRNPNDAWESLIDTLLASPHYGEHWGQHWLDVVRYADTAGFSNDFELSNAWRYRDYVIRSFNSDKPYDQFIMEQVAGDELNPDDPELRIAVGFLRVGPWEHTPMTPDKVSRQNYLDDVVNSVGQTFLSTPLRCCKCHDHKFDPIPTKDYYRFYAAFATTQPAERAAEFLPAENRDDFEEVQRQVELQYEFALKEQDALLAKREAAAKAWYEERGRAEEYKPLPARNNIPGDDKPPRHVGLTSAEEGILKVREQDVRIWKRRKERFQPLAQSVYNGGSLSQNSRRLREPNPNNKGEVNKSKKIPDTFVLTGGNVFTMGDQVVPGILSGVLTTNPNRRINPESSTVTNDVNGRRLAVAKWIASPENPLTTRSIVNRVWAWHFNKGIAANPNNFGATGGKPTHPELLDWLTKQFLNDGWSIKNLHRRIMLSATYRRSASHPRSDELLNSDPGNDLLAKFPNRRLSAEEIRDSILSITGELNPTIGGLPAMPEINLEVAMAPRMIQFSLAPAYQPSRTSAMRNRRSVYAYRVRGLPDPLMEVFNKPNANESCELREATSVTPQVFTLLNSQSMVSRSIAFANRIEQASQDDATSEQKIEMAIRLAYGRVAKEQELTLLKRHMAKMIAYHNDHTPAETKWPTTIRRSLVEEFTGEPFEYDELLSTYGDYQPDTQASDVSAKTRALADICMLIFNSNEFLYVY